MKNLEALAALLFVTASIAGVYSQPGSPAPTETVQIPADAFHYNGHHYYVFNNVVDTWEEAQRYCQNLGGHLATISGAAENRNVYDMMISCGYRNAYFGLTNLYEHGRWFWVNGERATYMNWSAGEPNNHRGEEHYGMYYHGSKPYRWNDGSFNEDITDNGGKAFICEWDQ